MLHALTREPGHPRSAFLDRCASLVSCDKYCAADAGAWHAPAADFLLLPPDSLEVHSDATLLPAELDGQRWVTLVITVRNPRARAVVVSEPREWVLPRAFNIVIREASGGFGWEETVADSSTLFFRPYETKSLLVEFRISTEPSRSHVAPGMLLLGGGYARRSAAYDTVAVTQ